LYLCQEQPPQGEAGEAGSSQQQGQPNEGQQRELQLDMQTAEGQLEECVPSCMTMVCVRTNQKCTFKGQHVFD
jgi:hypothetical protein